MKTPELPDETLFENALNQPNRAERHAYLDQACAGRPELRRRIEELLKAHEGAGDFMNGPASDLPTLGIDPAPEEVPGSMVGRYKLLQKIGEGGMGVVYMAEQAVPVVRKVALKIIKLGMDTRQVVARFEAERQALALMDHPNIAKVLDAGSTEAGRPFFVMELVRGVPITEYCDKNRLSARDRLELFLPVCHAIQHAHQKGIIHRDIKPSNVMVTLHDGRPVPRVIDFGIAKATNQRLTDKTLFTNYAQLIGTPAYMSPEQAEMSGLDIDTRADVYSLGVLLYELLVGATPFDAGELLAKGCAELQRFIAEQEPPRPSTRMSTLQDAKRTVVAANRSTDQAELRRSLEGDLDWIVMKCLEKDRNRRYETANGLAADLKRHLENEPVVARPPSVIYRLQKSWRRNKQVYATGVVVLIGLVALLSGLARERALKSESARADSIAIFVTGMLDKAVPLLEPQGNRTGIRVMLDAADELISVTLTNTPAAELLVRSTLQNLYNGVLQDPSGGMKQAERVGILLSLVPDNLLPRNQSRDDLRVSVAMARLWAGEVTQGGTELNRLVAEFRQRGPAAGRTLAVALSFLGAGLLAQNKPTEAEPLLAEAWRLEPQVGEFYSQLLNLNGKHRMAEEVASRNVERFNGERGGASQGIAGCYYPLVEALCREKRFQDAEKLVEVQLGSGAAREWTPSQIKGFQTLKCIVQAFSGQWREAVPGLIANAASPASDLGEWSLGIAAALAAADTNAYASLSQEGRARFLGNAEAETACSLFMGLILHPHEEDLSFTLPRLLHLVEEGKGSHGSVANLLFLKSQLEYRRGSFQESLRLLDTWLSSKDDRPHNAIMLATTKAGPLPDFWRAMILARLGAAEGSVQAYVEGIKKMHEGFPRGWDLLASTSTFFASQALRQEAFEVLRSQGMVVPEHGIQP